MTTLRSALPISAAHPLMPCAPASAPAHGIDTSAAPTTVEFVIPAFNEEEGLPICIERLCAHLTASFPFSWRVTIADNASTDHTLAVAHALAARQEGRVRVVHLDRKGRGNALRAAWLGSDAAVVAYMDVDLSTDLDAVLPLVAPLVSGHSDIAIGSRLGSGSRVVRGAKREFISRSYNMLLRIVLRTRFADAQCGFKAMRRDAAEALVPLVEDGNWFFDTELLVLAEHAGLRIHEVPVDWIDDPDSSVDIVGTAIEDLRGMRRIGLGLVRGTIALDDVRERLGREPLTATDPATAYRRSLPRHLVRFGAIGLASTFAYMALFALVRGDMGAQAANLLALLVTAIANTSANRLLTFGVRGRTGMLRNQLEGLVIFVLGVCATSGSLVVLHAASTEVSHATELAVLTIANLAVTLAKFVAFRAWVFHPRRLRRRRI